MPRHEYLHQLIQEILGSSPGFAIPGWGLLTEICDFGSLADLGTNHSVESSLYRKTALVDYDL